MEGDKSTIWRILGDFGWDWALVRLFSYYSISSLSYVLFSLPPETPLSDEASRALMRLFSLTSYPLVQVASLVLIGLGVSFALIWGFAEWTAWQENTRKAAIRANKLALFLVSLFGVPASIGVGMILARKPSFSLDYWLALAVAIGYFVLSFCLWFAQMRAEKAAGGPATMP